MTELKEMMNKAMKNKTMFVKTRFVVSLDQDSYSEKFRGDKTGGAKQTSIVTSTKD